MVVNRAFTARKRTGEEPQTFEGFEKALREDVSAKFDPPLIVLALVVEDGCAASYWRPPEGSSPTSATRR